MSQTIVFRDSRPNQPYEGPAWGGLLRAVERLNRDAWEGRIDLISLSGKTRRRPAELPAIIVPSLPGQRPPDGAREAAPLRFSVSHYIGSYSTKIDGETFAIEIRPRWGAQWLAYLLRYVAGIYLPPDAASRQAAREHGAEWLLVLLWRSLLEQALRRFHLPREYKVRETYERFFQGRLDVARHLRINLADQSRFSCLHRPLMADTAINRTVRHVLELLERRGHAGLVGGLRGHGDRLAGFGVACPKAIGPAEIDAIRYTKMTVGYRPLMQASRALLRRFGAGAAVGPGPAGASYLIDIAELWENCLQAILTARLPPEYRVFSPNDTGGEWLAEGELRRIRPDLLIEKNRHIVTVLDAKFKGYTRLGKYEKDGVSREDLYQMITYLYHYAPPGRGAVGLFVSPAAGENQAHRLISHPLHRVGVASFALPAWSEDGSPTFDLAEVRAAEAQFAKVVLQHLQAGEPDESR